MKPSHPPVRSIPAQLDLHPRPTHSGHSGRCPLPRRIARLGQCPRTRLRFSHLHLTSPSVLIQRSRPRVPRRAPEETCQSHLARGQLTHQCVDCSLLPCTLWPTVDLLPSDVCFAEDHVQLYCATPNCHSTTPLLLEPSQGGRRNALLAAANCTT
jgi:hypothetical protein